MWVFEKSGGEPQGGPEEFHEVWWIGSRRKEPWAGLRIAHFRKTSDGTLIFFIMGDTPDRTGPRVWSDVSVREGWKMIEQIPIPKEW
ncbi:hypothetical protein [Mesorhizobium sp. SP-1A]|uniref:hypothetical protein n=1 Tax=Mesorhizobium sp. SP-1A TaxID=3077840 RepID=UPI0028F6C3B5|nr:hypothetical protein [Mesorhizobium sp. SP-1A]